MLRLLDRSYGNRAPDDAGNTHTRFDWEGKTVFRDPGPYTGAHRRPELPWPLQVVAPLFSWVRDV